MLATANGIRRPRSHWAFVIALGVIACDEPPHPKIEITTGSAPEDHRSLVPTVALAEYVELEGLRNELRLMFADYAIDCSAYVSPPPDRTLLSVVIQTPPDMKLEPGRYEYLPDSEAQDEGGFLHPHAQPVVRMGPRSSVPPPGGAIEISALELADRGHVRGRLDFSYSGGPNHPATRVNGSFDAQVCRAAPVQPR